MEVTQKDIDLFASHNKQIRVKATLFDDNYRELSTLSGAIKPSASFNNTSDSDIRKTCTLTIVTSNKDEISSGYESAWLRRMVELSIGIFDFSANEYKWYPMGRMLVTSMNVSYSATSQEIKLSLVDLMASLAEERGSQMGSGMLVPAGSNMRDALIAIVSTFSPYKRYNIPEFEDVVPYDINISSGEYPYSAIKELLELYPYYEAFYDAEGIFTVQKIPTKIEDPIDIGVEIIDAALISEEQSIDFSKVRNTTEIWGRSLDAEYTATSCTTDGNCYNLVIDKETFDVLEEGHTYGFTPDTTSVVGQTIKIQDTDKCPIVVESGNYVYTPIEEGAMQQDIPYVVRYSQGKFILQGELEIHVIYQEIDQMPTVEQKIQFRKENNCRDVQWNVNPESPFACTITAGQIDREIRQVLEGGEYSNIYTTQLALERASYENWLKTRLQDTVELEMLLIPWMDVNDKIEYTSPSSGEKMTMLVQSISYDLARWTMTVKCSKFYPYYPWW